MMTEAELKAGIERREQTIKGGLRAERNRANISQADCAAAIGANRATLSAWEQGAGSIGLEEAWRLADLFGITLDQLAGRNLMTAGT